MAAIAKTSPTHDMIALWVLENPGPRLVTRCAAYFGYTVAWMSTIMNSDAFRARLSTVQDSADAAVVSDIPAKLRGVAGLALDALAEQVDMAAQDGVMAHREFLKETADMALSRLGFAPQRNGGGVPGNTVINNNTLVTVDPNALALARQHFSALPHNSVADSAIAVETLPLDSSAPPPPR